MLLHKIDIAKDYVQYILNHAGETNLLYQDLLIHVTSFFRDQEAMEYLQKTLLPKILKSKTNNEPIRIWVPACSTGEEAYSIAMVLLEGVAESGPGTAIQIFATDISELAITKARLGLYSKNELANVSPARLQR